MVVGWIIKPVKATLISDQQIILWNTMKIQQYQVCVLAEMKATDLHSHNTVDLWKENNPYFVLFNGSSDYVAEGIR